MSKLESLFEDFQKAVKRFSEALEQEKNEFMRDSAIQRFEFTFDIGWKTLKAFLEEYHNARCTSPKTCFREAFGQGLIDYDELWLKIADWRNQAVHTYNEKLADALYKKLPQALNRFQLLEKNIKELIKQEKKK